MFQFPRFALPTLYIQVGVTPTSSALRHFTRLARLNWKTFVLAYRSHKAAFTRLARLNWETFVLAYRSHKATAKSR